MGCTKSKSSTPREYDSGVVDFSPNNNTSSSKNNNTTTSFLSRTSPTLPHDAVLHITSCSVDKKLTPGYYRDIGGFRFQKIDAKEGEGRLLCQFDVEPKTGNPMTDDESNWAIFRGPEAEFESPDQLSKYCEANTEGLDLEEEIQKSKGKKPVISNDISDILEGSLSVSAVNNLKGLPIIVAYNCNRTSGTDPADTKGNDEEKAVKWNGGVKIERVKWEKYREREREKEEREKEKKEGGG